jgi:Rrf2 family iron-sulfur cluster assembly transcriptional regulator
MKLTLSVGYGIGVLLQIQGQAQDGPLTAARISRGCRFPPRFLYRVLRKLVDAGLLQGTSGPGGGYALARRPQDITLLDIVRSVDSGVEPAMLEAVCPAHRPAIVRVNELCRRSAEHFAAELSHVSLADLERLDALEPRRPRGRVKAR